MRVKFLRKGEQRKFLKKVLEETNCSSLRTFEQFGLDVHYSTMKNYFSEQRLLPRELFGNLCYLAKLDSTDFEVTFLEDSWGQIKGGKRSKKIN